MDDKLRTTAEWVYAAGDCAGRFLFTHSAAAEAVTGAAQHVLSGLGEAPSGYDSLDDVH